MRRKFVNKWDEYREPIDLLDRPSHVEVGLCWCQKDHGSLWTSDLTYHVMVYLQTIIALATINVVLGNHLCELHPTDEKCLMILSMMKKYF